MKTAAPHLQDSFLNLLIEKKLVVSLYLVSGIKLQGCISAFDNTSILLSGPVDQLVYKHAISSVVPDNAVELITT